MPTHMAGFFEKRELENARMVSGGKFTGELPIPQIPAECYISAYQYGNLLFDLKKDPQQENSIENSEREMYFVNEMRKLMEYEDAPKEQYERLGI